MGNLTLAYHHPVRVACDRCAWMVFSFGKTSQAWWSKSILLLLAAAYMAGPFLALAGLVGVACGMGLGPGFWCALAVGVGLHWALTPFLKGTSVRPLYPDDYRAIEAMMEPSWPATLAQWARHQPKFDTRHLEACQRAHRDGSRGQAVPEVHRSSFRGKDAWDLCDGLIGRMVQASRAAERLEAGTDTATTPPAQDAANARRL